MNRLALLAFSSSLLTPAALATDTEVTALRARLSPAAIAAAAVPPTSVSTVVEDLEASDAFVNGDLAAADAAYRDAKVTHDTLQRLVRRGQATEQQVADLQQAKTDLAAADAARDTALDALFTAATSSLTAGQRGALSVIRGNLHWKQPTEFLVVDRTEAEWCELRDLLQAEHVWSKHGWPPDTAVVTRLAELRARTEVAAAKVSLDATGAAVRAAWSSAVGE